MGEWTSGYAEPAAAVIDRPVSPRGRVVQIARPLLIGVLLVDVALNVVTHQRHASLDELGKDLSAGRVEFLALTDADELRHGQWHFRVSLGSDPEVRPVVLWRTGVAGYKVAELGAGEPFLPAQYGIQVPGDGTGTSQAENPDGSDGMDDDTDATRSGEAVRAAAEATGVTISGAGPWGDRLLRWDWLGAVGWLAMLVMLVTGPQPRRATKWAWFWLYLLPAHAGLLYALAREAPWNATVHRTPEPLPHRAMVADIRFTGGKALLTVLLVGALAQVLVAALDPHWP